MADLTSPSSLKKLDEYLVTRTYITGYVASRDDITVYAGLTRAPPAEYVNVSRWYNHIKALLKISDETNMKKLEEAMSSVTLEGSLWGASDCTYFANLTLN